MRSFTYIFLSYVRSEALLDLGSNEQSGDSEQLQPRDVQGRTAVDAQEAVDDGDAKVQRFLVQV